MHKAVMVRHTTKIMQLKTCPVRKYSTTKMKESRPVWS